MIGIIMPQLNVLPVNVLQNVETKDELAPLNSTTSKDGFSKYIDLHLSKNKGSESNGQVDDVKSETNMAKKDSESMPETKKPGDLVGNSEYGTKNEKSNKNDESDLATHVQKVAASGNKDHVSSSKVDPKALLESEQLMSFLTKADNTLTDNTLTNQAVDTTSSINLPEQLPVDKQLLALDDHNKAQLLLKSSPLVADSTETLLLSHAAKLAGKIESIENKESTGSKESTENKGKKDNAQAEVSAALVKSTENKTVLSELTNKLNTKTDVNVSYVSNVNNSDKLGVVNTEPNKTLTSEVLVDGDLVSKDDKGAFVTTEQKLAKQAKSEQIQMSNEKITQTTDQKEVNQKREAEVPSHSKSPENEKINTNTASQPTINQAEQTLETIKAQVSSSKQIQQEKISSLPDPQLQKSELTPSNEVMKANEVDKIKKAVSANNQLASTHHDESKAQAKQDDTAKSAVSFVEQNQQKSVIQKDDDILVADKVILNATKAPSTANHFIDVSGKATQTPQHIIDQQSVEMLNPSVSTEVAQSQKTNVQLHQETISLFRKDFTEAVKDKVMLMISQKLQQFDITLDPPELGNMQVRVNLQGEQAVVNFLVQSQQTKDALEQNMHKLKELLAEQGVDVGGANVEQQSQQSANEEGSTAGNNKQMKGEIDNMADANDVVAHTLSAQMIDSSTTSVDYYA